MTPRSDKANPMIVHLQLCMRKFSAGRQAFLAPLRCCLMLAVPWASGAIPAGPGYDAAFVGMTVPDRVRAAEVFPVAITLRNTGTNAWQGWAIRLRSIAPRTNSAWGTDYILIAQGTVVQPGSNYSFRSHLRAPPHMGPSGFQWQMCQDGLKWFGEATPARTIEVLAGAPETNLPLAVAARGADGRAMLAFADFEYAGSFKPPRTVDDARGAFSESGLALRVGPDGRERLLMNYTLVLLPSAGVGRNRPRPTAAGAGEARHDEPSQLSAGTYRDRRLFRSAEETALCLHQLGLSSGLGELSDRPRLSAHIA